MEKNINKKKVKLSLPRITGHDFSILAVLKPLKKTEPGQETPPNQKEADDQLVPQHKNSFLNKAQEKVKQGATLLSLLLGTTAAFATSSGSIVHDPTNALTLTDALTVGTKASNVTTQISQNMYQMNAAIGTATQVFNNPILSGLSGLSILGGCRDPYGDMKNAFLGIKNLKPSLNFCSLLSGQEAFTELLFIPFNQMGKGITHTKLEEINRNRQQAVQTSTVNALAFSAQVKKELPNMRRRIETLTAEAERNSSLIAQAQIHNKFLAVIASELVKLNGQIANANEMQGSGLSRTISLF